MNRSRTIIALSILFIMALAARFYHDYGVAHVLASHGDAPDAGDTPPSGLAAELKNAYFQQKSGNRTAAEEEFSRCAQMAPRDSRPYLGLSILALEDHRFDIARVNLLQAVKCDPSNPDAWQLLAGLYTRTRANRQAIDAYEHVISLRPNDPLAWRQIGVLETRSNLVARGHAALIRATNLNAGDLDAWCDLGRNDVIVGDLPAARHAFATVLAHRPGDPDGLAGSAEVTLQLDPSYNGLALAEQQLRSAMMQRRVGTDHLLLGRIFLLRKQYSSALAEFKSALALTPTLSSAYVYMSQAYAATGQSDLAHTAGERYQAAIIRPTRPVGRPSAPDRIP